MSYNSKCKKNINFLIIIIMSHFTKIKTKLFDLDLLKRSLKDLTIDWSEESKLVQGYKGKTYSSELVIKQDNNYDIGFHWNGKEYELVTDLMFWNQKYSVNKFLNQLNQRYAYNAILQSCELEGFTFTENKVSDNGSIRLVAKKFA